MMKKQRSNYKSKNENKCMGLYNKICYNPKYFCELKQVYLNDKDVRRKHCLNKSIEETENEGQCKYFKKLGKNYIAYLQNEASKIKNKPKIRI